MMWECPCNHPKSNKTPRILTLHLVLARQLHLGNHFHKMQKRNRRKMIKQWCFFLNTYRIPSAVRRKDILFQRQHRNTLLFSVNLVRRGHWVFQIKVKTNLYQSQPLTTSEYNLHYIGILQQVKLAATRISKFQKNNKGIWFSDWNSDLKNISGQNAHQKSRWHYISSSGVFFFSKR